MTKGLKEGTPNGRDVYPDIIDHPHWQSPTRPHMSLYDRAAQFASFDALAGYSDMIAEEERMTDPEIHPEEWELERLNRKLNLIADLADAGMHPEITFTVFIPDARKDGGKYVELRDTVKKIDPIAQKVVLLSTEGYGRRNRTIDFSRIIEIHGDLVDDPEDEIG